MEAITDHHADFLAEANAVADEPFFECIADPLAMENAIVAAD